MENLKIQKPKCQKDSMIGRLKNLKKKFLLMSNELRILSDAEMNLKTTKSQFEILRNEYYIQEEKLKNLKITNENYSNETLALKRREIEIEKKNGNIIVIIKLN